MANITNLLGNLTRRGFAARYFDSREQANAYLAERMAGKSVGIGGSVTVKEMGLDRALTDAGATIFSHQMGSTPAQAAQAECYISSLNGVAETGELVNIDGTGNRVASTIYGHKELFLVFGVNKVEEDLERALWRARNVAGPKNAMRLGRKTPCALRGDRCYDCDSPERICRALAILWGPPKGFDIVEVIVVGEHLGL